MMYDVHPNQELDPGTGHWYPLSLFVAGLGDWSLLALKSTQAPKDTGVSCMYRVIVVFRLMIPRVAKIRLRGRVGGRSWPVARNPAVDTWKQEN